jgi:peptidoglycan/xylan/chitin deacetylase (PgdA/CDA1 family)
VNNNYIKSMKQLGTPTKVLIFHSVTLLILLSCAQVMIANISSASAQNNTIQPCNCAIFRLDDIEDSAFSAPNIAIMNHFIAENKKLDNLMVLSKFGNSAPGGAVYNKVKEGFDKGLFELAIHGWNHLAHSQLTAEQQQNDFIQANNKLQSLFGTKSRIFGPPLNEFNSGTIKAMAASGVDIFSTAYSYEARISNPYKISTSYATPNSIIQLSEVNTTDSTAGVYEKKRIYHVPFSVTIFGLIKSGYSGEALTQEVLRGVDSNIAKYGFSVVTLHPNDVASYNPSTGIWSNSVDPGKMQVLIDIVDRLKSKGISFSDFRDISPAPFSEVIPDPVFTTTLGLNPITSVTWGKDVVVTGKLVDQSGAAMEGETITFDGMGASSLRSVVTNSDGSFIAMGPSPNTVATQWTVQAHFSGNQDHQPSNSVVRTYSTTKHAVSISVQAANTNVPWGTGTTFTATLTDSTTGGTVIAGKTIRFDGNGVIGVANQTTSDNGKALGKGTAPYNAATGWNYQAHFDGDSLYLKKDSTVKTYNTIKRNVAFTLALTPSSVSPGQSYVIGTTLSDYTSNNSPIINRTITFTADPPITPSLQQTDSQGKTRETLKAPSSSGTYNIQAFFGGDSLYNTKSSLSRTLTISGSTATSSQQASSENITDLRASSIAPEESSPTTTNPLSHNFTFNNTEPAAFPTVRSPISIPHEDTATNTINATSSTTAITSKSPHDFPFSTSLNNTGNLYRDLQDGGQYRSGPFTTVLPPLVTMPLQQLLPLNSSIPAPTSPSQLTSASIPAPQLLPQLPMPLIIPPQSYSSAAINTSPDTTISSVIDTSTELNIQNGQTVPLLSSVILTFFGSDLPIAGFQCGIDGFPSFYCTSPVTIDNVQLASGSTMGSSIQPSSSSHTFQVSAVDTGGNIDPSPASFEWNIIIPINSIKTDPFPTDTTAPDTQIVSAIDSNNEAVLNGSSTLTSLSSSAPMLGSQPVISDYAVNEITFSFAGIDISNSVAGYECATFSSSRLPGQMAFVPCTSPTTLQIPVKPSTMSTELGTGIDTTYIFRVRAIDAAGNVDPTPATFQWTDTGITGTNQEFSRGIGISPQPDPLIEEMLLLENQILHPHTLLPQLQTMPTTQ